MLFMLLLSTAFNAVRSKVIQDHYNFNMNTHLAVTYDAIEDIHNASFIECIFRCSNHPCCRSAILDTVNSTGTTCSLYDMEFHEDLLAYDQGFIYIERQDSKHSIF